MMSVLSVRIALGGALTHGTSRVVNPIEKSIVLGGKPVTWFVSENDWAISLADLNLVRALTVRVR